MSIFYPILVLLLTASVMLIIHLSRPRFAYHWLIAASGALIVLPLTVMSASNLPQTIILLSTRAEDLFPSYPVLLLDQISFSYVAAMVALTFATILTDVLRASEIDRLIWAGGLFLPALGIFAILAGDLFTLLIGWTAIDLFELALLLPQVHSNELRIRVVVTFGIRVLGSGLLVASILAAYSSGNAITLSSIPPRVNLFLLLAAGLRLGILPLHLPFPQELPLRRGFGTILRMTSAAANLCLVARAASVDEPVAFASLILLFAALTAIYTSIAWSLATNELEGRPYWILGMAAFALASAVRGQASASLSWGIATLLAGGLLFLNARRDHRLNWLFGFGLLGISTLPYSPTWEAVLLYASPFQPTALLFFIAHVLLLLGYLRHALRPGRSLSGVERWVWLIYPLGLVTLLVAHFSLAWWAQPERNLLFKSLWWMGLLISGVVALIVVLLRYAPRLPQFNLNFSRLLAYTQWQYRWGGRIYRLMERVMNFIPTVLEGEGGVLWALLLLVLLISWLASVPIGG